MKTHLNVYAALVSLVESNTVSLTWEFAGFVANLSLFSPNSSNSMTTLSIVTTASFWLFADQAIAVTLHAPS